MYSFDRLALSVFFLNSELRDKGEPVTGMLTGANQAGHRCGKYQSVCSWTRFCTVSLGRQSRQAPMCEIDDLSHAQEARVERGGSLPEELIIIFLISHHKSPNDIPLWLVRNSEAAFQLCTSPSSRSNLSQGQQSPYGGKPIHPSHVSASSLCLTNSYESLTLKESIVIQPNTTPTPLLEYGKKGSGTALALAQKAFPPGLGWLWQTSGQAHREGNATFRYYW